MSAQSSLQQQISPQPQSVISNQQNTQTQQIIPEISDPHNQIKTIYSRNYEPECYLCKNGLHGKEINTSQHQFQQPQQISTTQNQVIVNPSIKNEEKVDIFYSGNYEPQCYLCQHGLHGKEQNSSQHQLQPSQQQISNSKNQIIINTPTKKEENINVFYSPQYEPQCYLCQNNLHKKDQLREQCVISSQYIGQPQLVYVSPERVVSQKIVEGAQTYKVQQTQQASPQQMINVGQYYNGNNQVLQASVANVNNLMQQQQTFHQNSQIITENINVQNQQNLNVEIQGQQQNQVSEVEQIEMFWRNKVYELQERQYQLVIMVNQQKQEQLISQQKSGSAIKKNTEIKFQIEQLQQQIQQLDSQYKFKQNISIQRRNQLNVMIYKQDQTDDSTRYKEQELQQLRQKFNSLNFKLQSNKEDIAMTQAVIEALKSGKNYKLISVSSTIQTKQSTNNQQNTTQSNYQRNIQQSYGQQQQLQSNQQLQSQQ